MRETKKPSASRRIYTATVPTFCRHGGLIEACPICRTTILPTPPATPRSARSPAKRPSKAPAAKRAAPRGGLRVRQEARAADDGYRCLLVPGLRAEVEARQLARELGFASGRTALLGSDPPGLYGEVASASDIEEATWLAFQIVLCSPLESADPFASISAARTTWAGGETPDLTAVARGPRSPLDPARWSSTIEAYRRWAAAAGSQHEAFTGDLGWSAQWRFERIFERLSLPGLGRQGRYDLLVTLGAIGLYELSAPGLLLTDDDTTSRTAKRVFAIGDRMTLERRANALALEAGVAFDALELALTNWQGTKPITLGVPRATNDEAAEARALTALGLQPQPEA
jgi:alpha-glutamyl/putrescinyl thymine pyrophosphorylase-like protein